MLGEKKTSLFGASGGNAGLALAVAAATLKVPCTVFVPETTMPMMRAKIAAANARVVVFGEHFAVADEAAKRECAMTAGAGYVHAFDDPVIWDGHASIVEEMREQLKGEVPSTIVLSVGGGGLLLGVNEGLKRVGWAEKVRIVCVETRGAESFHQCIVTGTHARLDGIRSVAKTLGAVQVCRAAFELAMEKKNSQIRSVLVSDDEALDAIGLLRACPEAGGKLVEPACAAALAAVAKRGFLDERDTMVVVIVCGGNAVSDELLAQYRREAYRPYN